MQKIQKQEKINNQNAEFWNELCGTGLAQHLGIKDHSPESLKRFDQYYFDYYPYLLKYMRSDVIENKKVLEIGLGYGTLGQYIAHSASQYYGLDIAEGPVKMMNHRLRMLNLPEMACQGNMLECPFESGFFDTVISIGCFHHTGNLQRCFDQTYRILKPGGSAIMMVYNKYSCRQWFKNFKSTLLSSLSLNKKNCLGGADRAAYDVNQTGDAAPETILSSIKELRKMLKNFSSSNVYKENFDDSRYIKRKYLLNNVANILGLDIYIECIK
jgi:SAM-dependent methyltransferase